MSKLCFNDFFNNRNQIDSSVKGSLSQMKLDSPINIDDDTHVKEIYQKLGIEPFFGTRQNSKSKILWLLNQLALFCPSANSCISQRKKACFGGLIDAKKVSSDGFVITDEEVNEPQKKEFFEWLRNLGITGYTLRDLAMDTEMEYLMNGNSWVVATLTQFADEKRVTFQVYPQSWCHYVTKQDNTDVQQVMITKKLDKEYWKKNPPMIVDMYESFDRINFNEGVATIAFHNKNNCLVGLKYGLPESIGSMYNQYNEWQNGDYLVTETDNSLLGRLYFFIEQDSIEGDFITGDSEEDSQDEADQIRRHLNDSSTKGSKAGKAINVLLHPNGTKIDHLIVPPNTNEKWYKEIKDYNSSYIYASYGWSKYLTGLDNPSGGIGGNTVIDTLKQVNVFTIKPAQSRKESFIGSMLNVFAEWTGTDMTKEVGIKFNSPYEELLKIENEQDATNGEGSNTENANI